MKKKFVILLLLLLVSAVHTTQAQESVFANTFDSYTLGDLDGQDNWAVTKYYTDTLGTVQISSANSDGGEKYAEITNNDSIVVSRTIAPLHSGMLQFKMRHNKSGLFYLQAQTSDAGGQLLFSIQFTASKGILLEEAQKQTTLLSEYSADQWYNFTINFDNAKGENGTFNITIDSVDYGEHDYVNSESETFDLAQLTFGSESEGQTAISGFSETGALLPQVATSTATSTVSESLRQLSISFATSSITANLDDGLTVVASLDGKPTTPSSSTTSLPTEEHSSIGQLLRGIVENVIDIFTESTDEVAPTAEAEIPITTDRVIPENEVPSSVQTDIENNEIITTTF